MFRQPEKLQSEAPLTCSYGRGSDVWRMFCAAAAGDVAALRLMLAADPAPVRCHCEYRTALYFVVRENRVEAARVLLRRSVAAGLRRQFHRDRAQPRVRRHGGAPGRESGEGRLRRRSAINAARVGG